MIKLERYEVMNFENAMRGARNPLNSWARMDSKTENGVFTFLIRESYGGKLKVYKTDICNS